MTIVKPNKVEWVSFFVLMPVIAAANCFVLFGSSWFLRFGYWLYGFGTMMLIGLLFWYIDVVLTRFIHDRFAAYQDTIRRVFSLVIKQFAIATLSFTTIIAALMQFPLADFLPTTSQFIGCVAIALTVTLIAMVIWEGDYIFQQWKQSLTENEKYTRLSLQGDWFELPAREFEVLWELMTPPGRVVSKRTLADKLSGFDEALADNALEAFISRLRKKLVGSGASIRTLRGLGYLLEAEA